jgi:hypothetical protein
MLLVVGNCMFYNFTNIRIMANSLIDFEITWSREATECQQCEGCKDTIYSDVWRAYINGDATETVLCEGCYALVRSL